METETEIVTPLQLEATGPPCREITAWKTKKANYVPGLTCGIGRSGFRNRVEYGDSLREVNTSFEEAAFVDDHFNV